jgi:aspartate aminotransferase
MRLKSEGHVIYGLGGGEPNFPTPPEVVEEACAAMREGFTHYTSSRGIPELLDAIGEKLRVDNHINMDPYKQVIVTPSAKHALFVAMATILDPGDEIIVPTPSWVSYDAMAGLINATMKPLPLSADDNFTLTRSALDRCLSPRTRALLINTPNNPTGRALTESEIDAVAGFVADNDLWLVCDEIYEKILYNGHSHLSPGSRELIADRTITINGFSKTYAMTGWRLGYLAGPKDIIDEANKVQQHTVGCAASFAQRAAVVALTKAQPAVEAMLSEYAARRSMIVDGLNRIPGIECSAPDGAFYVLPKFRDLPFDNSIAFSEWLLDHAKVAVTPGQAFGPGAENHVRLSFATSRETIEGALHNMEKAITSLHIPSAVPRA